MEMIATWLCSSTVVVKIMLFLPNPFLLYQKKYNFDLLNPKRGFSYDNSSIEC